MLHETCILVSLSISLPPQTRIARTASDKVEAEYETAPRQGRVTKSLYSAVDIKPLSKAMTRARTLFNELSLPYDAAFRIIPSTSYFEFTEHLRGAARDFNEEKDFFLNRYDEILERAAEALGKLYNPDDYPSREELEQTISFSVDTSVIPSTTAYDDLAGLTPEVVEKLKEDALAGQQSKVEEALMDLFKRLFNSLSKAAVKLADEDAIFRDTLIGNINGALAAVESLNLTNDKALIDMAEEVKRVIEGIEPDDLRKDKDLRKQTAESTKELVNKLGEFF